MLGMKTFVLDCIRRHNTRLYCNITKYNITIGLILFTFSNLVFLRKLESLDTTPYRVVGYSDHFCDLIISLHSFEPKNKTDSRLLAQYWIPAATEITSRLYTDTKARVQPDSTGSTGSGAVVFPLYIGHCCCFCFPVTRSCWFVDQPWTACGSPRLCTVIYTHTHETFQNAGWWFPRCVCLITQCVCVFLLSNSLSHLHLLGNVLAEANKPSGAYLFVRATLGLDELLRICGRGGE